MIDTKNIVGIIVYLQRKKTRLEVGLLKRAVSQKKPIFQWIYSAPYLRNKFAISLGPELPLTKRYYESKELFEAFKDRIPDPENPAYGDYCRTMGINLDEKDPFILLATIGRQGPSSFIFEPLYAAFTAKDLQQYRKYLGLSLREFSIAFDLSFSHLQRIESGQFPGAEILKRMEIYRDYPGVALSALIKKGTALHTNIKRRLIMLLQSR